MSDVTVKFSAEDQNLSKTVSNIQKDLNRLDAKSKDASKGFDLSFGKIGLAAGVAGAAVKAGMMAVEGATAAARAVVDGFGQAIDLGGQLDDLSSRTGETAGNLLVLQKAFELAGVGADKVGGSVNKLQKFISEAASGGTAQNEALSQLGLTLADLEGKTPTEQMQIFAKRIAGISDPADRARAAMDIFGKSGGELLPLLNNFSGQMDEAQFQLGSLPGVMDRSAAAFASLGDNLDSMGSKAMQFAAGFIEDALPALNAFTKSLSGIDAAGWGQKLMEQVMQVADFLIGAFKAPMPAIEAIGAALEAGAKIAGNNYLNSLINAGKFLSAFFSSDLPGIITGVLGNSLLKAFVDSAKAFIDAIRGVIQAFETWLGDAISNVVDFFATKFFDVLGAVAQDFKSAMADPIGFVSGKLDSALGAVMANGGATFQSSFEKGGGSALDKISAGLGAVSDEYGQNIAAGVDKAKDSFGRLIDSIEPSAKDFFGAEDAAKRATEKFGEVTKVGSELRKEFENSAAAAEGAKDNTSAAAAEAEAIAGSFNKAEGSTKKIKEELSASAKLLGDIAKARESDGVDRGGRLQSRAQEQLSRGDFRGAERTAARIAGNEAEARIRGVGENRDRRSLADIGKDFGVSRQNGESTADFRQRITDVREGRSAAGQGGKSSPLTASVDKPGQDGKPAAEKGKSGGKQSLDGLVDQILKLVQKIEPRLPVAALSA